MNSRVLLVLGMRARKVEACAEQWLQDEQVFDLEQSRDFNSNTFLSQLQQTLLSSVPVVTYDHFDTQALQT